MQEFRYLEHQEEFFRKKLNKRKEKHQKYLFHDIERLGSKYLPQKLSQSSEIKESEF